MDAVVLPPGEGESHAMGPNTVVIKAGGEETAGTFYVGEVTIHPGFPGPPPHVHDKLHDMFYVLHGTLNLRVADETYVATPGTFACVPPGTVHTFWNAGDEPVRFLNFNTPAGWEGYMRALAEASAAGAPMTPEEIGTVASRFDFRPV